MISYALSLFTVWSLNVARTKGLQPGVCLLPVTQPDQLFQGAPGSQQLLGEVTADGYEHCIVQCCNNTEGLCNVVLYKVNIEEVQTTPNCRLYRCQPVAACSFYTFDGLEVFADVEGEVDGAKSTHAPAGNTTSQGGHEVTEPEDRGEYNTTVSPNVGAAKPGDNSTDTEGATTQNVTGTTVKSVSQTPSVANVTQPSDVFNKTEVSLVSEGNVTSTQNLTTSTAVWQPSVNRTDSTASSQDLTSPHTDPHGTDGGAISTSSTEERTGSTLEQLTTTGPNPDVTTNQPQAAQTSPSDDVAEGTNWQEVADQGTRFTSFSVLITSLVVGCLFFVAAIVLIVKRCHDGWKKRHYSRVEYLVEGMYEE